MIVQKAQRRLAIRGRIGLPAASQTASATLYWALCSAWGKRKPEMPSKESSGRTSRLVAQRLEALERAGVTHVPKVRGDGPSPPWLLKPSPPKLLLPNWRR